MKKLVLGVIASVGLVYGAGFAQMSNVGGMHLSLSSEKDLTLGHNKLHISMMNGSKSMDSVKDMRIKFFMPEMPGMPYMESKDICTKDAQAYTCNINFSMNGTWQYMMYVTDTDGKKHKYRNSVNVGGSNMNDETSSSHEHMHH